jgi:DNA primase
MIPAHLDFKRLKRTVSIADVLAHKGLMKHYKKHGRKLTGPCPVHGGDNPRAFVVNLTENIWHCFTGCNTGGDLIEFVRRMDRKSYRHIAEYLSGLAGTQPVQYEKNNSKADLGGKKALDQKPFRPFKKRLSLDTNTPWLGSKGIHPATARQFETGAWYGPGFLQDCIGVRLHDPLGRPVGYAGRRLNQMHIEMYGKWKFPTGLPKADLLYNFHRIRSSMQHGVVVVECPWGAMRLTQLSIPAVALLGTSLSEKQLSLLIDIPCIVLMLDGDRAGRNAMQRIKPALEPSTSVRTFILPENLDPDDLDDDHLKKVSDIFLS